MAFLWRANDGLLLWNLDPLSPHHSNRHWNFFKKKKKKKRCQSQNFLDPRLLRDREREREIERDDRDDAPTHPLTKISGISAHELHTRIKSWGPGPLTVAVFLFNDHVI